MAEKTAARTFYALLVTLVTYYLIWQTVAARVTLPTYYYARLIELLGIFLFAALALLTPMRFEEMSIRVPLTLLFRSLALGMGASLAVIAVGAVGLPLFHGTPLPTLFVKGDVSRFTYFLGFQSAGNQERSARCRAGHPRREGRIRSA